MEDKWFCRIGDREFGPLLIAQLQRLAARGQLTASSSLRREGTDRWITAAEVPALKIAVGETSGSVPSAKPPSSVAPGRVTGRSTPPPPPSDEIPTGLPIVVQQPAAAAISPGQGESAGMTRGMLAILIGLGSIAAILLVVIAVIVTNSGKRESREDAYSQNVPSTDAGDEQIAARAADAESAVQRASAGESARTPLVDRWSEATSTKVIIKLCTVRINAIWVSDDPGGKVDDIPKSIVKAIKESPSETKLTDDDVLDITALGVTRKRRVDPTGKILDPGPEPDSTPVVDQVPRLEPLKDIDDFRYIFIELSLVNTSSNRTLGYLGWNGNGETTAPKDAKLYDEDNNPCLFISRIEAPRDDRRQQAVVPAGETIVDVLVFELPQDGFESLQLVLPQAAFGLVGNLGFKIQKSDIVVASSSSGGAAATHNDEALRPASDRPPSIDAIEQAIQNERDEVKTTAPDAMDKR